MYLSRIQLNPHSKEVWRDVVDQPHSQHQIVMQGFPDGVDRQEANVLHRLDQYGDTLTLLVQSTYPPDWQPLDPALLLPRDSFDPLTNPAVQEVSDLGLESGRVLSFRLRANPSKRLFDRSSKLHGKRVEFYKEADQFDWLHKKAEQHGFAIDTTSVRITPQGKQRDHRRRLTIFTVQYDGRLQITDHNKFNHSLIQGIGPAKAFGCGLLSLAPA